MVYTPAHATLASTYALDLNHDGTVDFYFVRGNVVDVGGSDRVSYLQVCHMPSQNFSHICVSSKSSPIADNAVRILTSGAAALPAGAKIANGEKFEGPGVPALMAARHYYSNTFNTAQHWDAPWANGGKGRQQPLSRIQIQNQRSISLRLGPPYCNHQPEQPIEPFQCHAYRLRLRNDTQQRHRRRPGKWPR